MEEQYSLTYLDTTHPITMDRFRMILANPAAQTKGWVIVEGEADNIAYSRFLNGTDRMVMKAGYTAKDNTEHGGKKAVQNIVDNTLREDLTNNIIGIVDRDYRDFEQTQTELPAHVVQTSSYGEKALTQYMIDACTADIFSHTHLYSAIKSWQTDKHVSIVI